MGSKKIAEFGGSKNYSKAYIKISGTAQYCLIFWFWSCIVGWLVTNIVLISIQIVPLIKYPAEECSSRSRYTLELCLIIPKYLQKAGIYGIIVNRVYDWNLEPLFFTISNL